MIKDRVAGYGFGDRVRSQPVYIALPKGWAQLGFYYGGELLNPEHLLESEGKRLRHVKIRSAQNLDKPAIRE